MVKVNRLKAKIVELEMTVETVAERMGLDKSTLYRRLQAPENLTVKEVRQLTDVLCLSSEEAQSIFFG